MNELVENTLISYDIDKLDYIKIVKNNLSYLLINNNLLSLTNKYDNEKFIEKIYKYMIETHNHKMILIFKDKIRIFLINNKCINIIYDLYLIRLFYVQSDRCRSYDTNIWIFYDLLKNFLSIEYRQSYIK